MDDGESMADWQFFAEAGRGSSDVDWKQWKVGEVPPEQICPGSRSPRQILQWCFCALTDSLKKLHLPSS